VKFEGKALPLHTSNITLETSFDFTHHTAVHRNPLPRRCPPCECP
jgi:hypothetical protein